MLTPEGARLVWEIAAGASTDSIQGGTIVVANGDETASAQIANLTFGERSMTVGAVFGPDDGNFDWLERRVVSRDGVVIDEVAEDGGRKAKGAIWTAEAVLNIIVRNNG